MTLELRAQRAARSIRASVQAVRPAASFRLVLRRQRIAHLLVSAAAAVTVVTALVAALAYSPLAGVSEVAEDPPATEAVSETTVAVDEVAPEEGADVDDVAKTIPSVGDEEPASTGPGLGGSDALVAGALPPLAAAAQLDDSPPELFLTIDRPEDGARLGEKVVRFQGSTTLDAQVNVGKFFADVDAEGHWALILVLRPGKNRVTFTATGADGVSTTASVTVSYDAPDEGYGGGGPDPECDDGGCEPVPKCDDGCEPVPKCDDGCQPPPVEFSASQKFGSCAESPPYDVFFGTAAPGTTITISSPYGSGSTTVGTAGKWDRKVIFAGAPYGETFTVTVSDGTGHSKSFSFTSYAG
ncbi:MAG: hypothetical protein ACE5KX_00350 [Acidimicrobiia bacterium]